MIETEIWLIIQEDGGSPPEGSLAKAIDSQFGSLDKLITRMNTAGAGVQGSGWVVRPLHFNCFKSSHLHCIVLTNMSVDIVDTVLLDDYEQITVCQHP